MTELKNFDSLAAEITLFVAPTAQITITDLRSADEAINAVKVIKQLSSELDRKRKELVAPLNNKVKEINAYAGTLGLPLERAEQSIKAKLAAFEVEQEKKQAEARAKLEAEKRALEAEAERKRQEALAAAQAKLEEQLDTDDEVSCMFGCTDEESEEAKAVAVAEVQRELAVADAQIEREKVSSLIDIQGKSWELDQHRIKGARKAWKCELIDINQVPKEFLIITLNQNMVLASARAGNTNIPGVRLYQETSISVGPHTRVPRAALRGED